MTWFDEGTKRQRWRHRLLTLVALWLLAAAYARFKPLPAGVSWSSRAYLVPASSVRFLADVLGSPVARPEIFDAVTSLIREAERFVVVDFYLFQATGGSPRAPEADLADALTRVVVAKRRAQPQVPIIFITDPITTVYGGAVSPQLEELRQAGVTLVETRLTKLRDANPLYAGLWRSTVRWLGNRPGGQLKLHPFDPTRHVSLRSWLALVNYKANVRRLVIADRGPNVVSLVTSWDPQTSSATPTNLALEFVNGPWRELVASEEAVADFSDQPFSVNADSRGVRPTTATSTVTIQVATEGKIGAAVEEQLRTVQAGDEVHALVWQLSDRSVVSHLMAAAGRGAAVRVILDPNHNASRRGLEGLPNRPVASELMLKAGKNLFVRWYARPEAPVQATMLLLRRQDGSASLMTGSAAWTKRNLRDFNLSTAVVVSGDQQAQPLRRAAEFFDSLWSNRGGEMFTTEYATYRDDRLLRAMRYRFIERTGLGSY